MLDDKVVDAIVKEIWNHIEYGLEGGYHFFKNLTNHDQIKEEWRILIRSKILEFNTLGDV